MEMESEHVLPAVERMEDSQPAAEGEKPVPGTFKIRKDLQQFFEIADHEQRTLKCKLAGQNHCKMDGVMAALKFCPQRGWNNFDRHLQSAHKMFKEGSRLGKRKKSNKERHPVVTCGLKSSSSGYVETKWTNLLSKEKYCVVCREEFPVSDSQDGITTDDFFYDQLKRSFPGCEGSSKLCRQLFFIFFLRNIIEFPAEKCEIFLRQCRGRRTPDTWFFLCLTCRGMVVEAAAMHNQLTTLEKNLYKIKKLIKLKIGQDNGAKFPLSSIEEEIRNYIIFPNNENCARSNAKLNQENADISVASSSLDEDWIGPELEDNYDDIDVCTTATKRYNTRRRRKRRKKNCPYIDYDELDEELDDMENENAVMNDPLVSKSNSTIIKVDPDSVPIYEDEGDEDVEYHSDHDGDDDCEIPGSSAASDFEISKFSSEKSLKSKYTLSKANRRSTLKKSLKRGSKLKATEHDASLGSEDEQKDNDKGHDALLERENEDIDKKDKDNDQVEKEAYPYVCQLCPSKYKAYGRLRAHVEAHEISKTQDNEYDCQQCGYPCHTEQAQAIHFQQKHATVTGVPCTLCNHSAPNQKHLTRHLKKHRDEAETERIEGKYLCKLCNRLFMSYDILCKHKRAEHSTELGVDPFRCEQCLVIFSSKRHLRDHIRQTHQKQSRYFCELCGKGMLYMSKLKRHMTVHLKDKSFVCEVCGADFLYSETMKDHIKKEHPEVEAAASGTCNSGSIATSSKCSVKFICKHCNIECASSTLLSRHIKSHTELYANKCNLCNKGYATPQSLRRHMEINHTKNEVPCSFCGKKFPHQEYVRTHYKFCKKYPGAKKPKELDGKPFENRIVDDRSRSSLENDDNSTMIAVSLSTDHVNQIQANVPEISDNRVVQHDEMKFKLEYHSNLNGPASTSPVLPSVTSGTVVFSMASLETTDSWNRLNDS